MTRARTSLEKQFNEHAAKIGLIVNEYFAWTGENGKRDEKIVLQFAFTDWEGNRDKVQVDWYYGDRHGSYTMKLSSFLKLKEQQIGVFVAEIVGMGQRYEQLRKELNEVGPTLKRGLVSILKH